MTAAIRSAWALFLGIALIMLGNGLQGSLLTLRAGLEGFTTPTVGVVMTGYYLGFLTGSLLAPRVVLSVGHVRVFAALASLASTSVLIHVLLVEPLTWFLMRLVSGFAYAGLYVVAESWLNDRATNETRGRLLSIYMIVMFAGVAGGQLMLNVASPHGFELFILASVLVSIALIPLLISASPAPEFREPAKMGFKQLYRVSPLGVFGCVGTGAAHSAAFSMGALYGQKMGYSVAQISMFMGLITIGGILLQWPLGWLSDRFDRRKVLTQVTILATLVAALAIPVAEISTGALLALMALFGGLSLPMYSLCLAHTNDHLEPAQMVAASASLVFTGGVGACAGPFTAAMLMAMVGPQGLFWTLVGAHGAIGVFALYRMSRRAPVPLEEQRHYANAPARTTVVASTMVSEESTASADSSSATEGKSSLSPTGC